MGQTLDVIVEFALVYPNIRVILTVVVDLNVSKARIVLEIGFVFEINAKILVQELVDKTLNVLSLIIYQSVVVVKVSLVMLLSYVTQFQVLDFS